MLKLGGPNDLVEGRRKIPETKFTSEKYIFECVLWSRFFDDKHDKHVL